MWPPQGKIVILWEVGEVNQRYCGNHFAVHVYQTIVFYTLNLHSVTHMSTTSQ